MKKFYSIFIAFVICLVLVPFGAKAETVSETLQEAAAQEGITFNSDYSNDSSKVNVYLFRGHGCSHCYELIEYLTSIVDEYGKYFNLVSYEVWYNTDNSSLMSNVANVLGDTANGVPYLVIGKKTFIGYRASTDASAIKKAIKELYKSDDKYDVMDHLNEKNSDTTNENNSGNGKTYNNSLNSQASLYMMMILAFAIIAIYIVKSNSDVATLKSELYTISDQLEELSTKKETTETKTTKKVVKTTKKSE